MTIKSRTQNQTALVLGRPGEALKSAAASIGLEFSKLTPYNHTGNKILPPAHILLICGKDSDAATIRQIIQQRKDRREPVIIVASDMSLVGEILQIQNSTAPTLYLPDNLDENFYRNALLNFKPPETTLDTTSSPQIRRNPLHSMDWTSSTTCQS